MFMWGGTAQGDSIDLTKVDAFVVGQVPKTDPNTGQQMQDPEGKPAFNLCVFAVLGANQFPMRLCQTPSECQQLIRNILGSMKREYDKEHGGTVQKATNEDVQILLGS